MHKCKNPECNKEIPDNHKYCSQDCLKRAIEIRKEQKGKTEEISQDKAITEVIRFLGRDKDIKADYRQDHLSKILNYLHQQQTEELKLTLSKLALFVGIDYTHIKRNYVDGLVAFGILEVAHGSKGQIWRWKGVA